MVTTLVTRYKCLTGLLIISVRFGTLDILLLLHDSLELGQWKFHKLTVVDIIQLIKNGRSLIAFYKLRPYKSRHQALCLKI